MALSRPGAWLQARWYGDRPPPWFLLPLSALYGALSGARRRAYRSGQARAERLPRPVIVVGNLSVGGTGKTPLVLWLVDFLRAQGFRPGVVSRGYGGRRAGPRPVTATSRAEDVGDEPLLIARRDPAPLCIGRDRAAAARALLAAHPECDVIVSDDGLQHYRLARDLEIAVVDGVRGFGNGALLPAGPLREPPGRLTRVGAVVINAPPAGVVNAPAAGVTVPLALPAGPPAFAMRLTGETFAALCPPGGRHPAAEFRGRRLHALAGIGRPERFFEHLRGLGLEFTAHPFPDHHRFRPEDIALDGLVLMTEKDAVKCQPFADARHFSLAVSAQLPPAFGALVLAALRQPPPGSGARHG